MGKVTIFLVRHAQSAGNSEMNANSSNDDVSDLGKIEINLVGMHLSNVHFDFAYASNMKRAVETAAGILKHSKFSPTPTLQQDDRLRETDAGIFEGRSYKEMMVYCMSLNKHPLEWGFPGGEYFPDSGKRLLKCIEDLCKQILKISSNNPNVLIVSHSCVITHFLNVLHQSDHSLVGWQPKDLVYIRNASYVKFEVEHDQEDKLEFTFLKKFYSNHLACVNKVGGKHSNVLVNFTDHSSRAMFKGCVQQ